MKTKVSLMNIIVIVLSVIVISAMAVFAFVFLNGGGGIKNERMWASVLDGASELNSVSCGSEEIAPLAEGFANYYFKLTDSEGKSKEFEEKRSQDNPEIIIELSSFDDAISFGVEPTSSTVIATDESGAQVFSGTYTQFNSDFKAPEKGTINIVVNSEYENISLPSSESFDSENNLTQPEAYNLVAKFEYKIKLVYDVKVDFHLSADTVSQGDVLIFCADGLVEKGDLALEIPFEFTPTLQKSDKGYYAYIPFNYMRTPGEHTITATYNGEKMDFNFNVTEPEYDEQHLTVSSSTTSATIGSNTAMEDYNNKMTELSNMYDEKIYWAEDFIQPIEGSVTTEFGIKRFTNGATTPSRHAGIDLANAEGTPIGASNNGKVIFSGFLAVSGNTVVIEHGMGLHTIYMHMSELGCNEGDIVNRGETIGKVGTTGFSTGPHLHFQAQVGSMCISPWYLFDGTSGAYDIRELVNN